MKTLFKLGKIVISDEALRLLGYLEITYLLKGHVTGDFGLVGNYHHTHNATLGLELNREAVTQGFRVISMHNSKGTVIWIMTDAERTETKVLLAKEYQFKFQSIHEELCT